MRVSVIGAGVVGLATALELLQRGAEVTLFERNPGLGGNASWLAGGMLAPFCEGESAPPNVVALGAAAIDWWARHVPCVQRAGSLVVAPPRDAGEVDRFAARTRAWERVDASRIAELEPDLAGRFRKGLFFPSEGHVDPRGAAAAMIAALEEGGARVRFGEEYPGAAVAEVADLGASPADPAGRGRRPRLQRAHDDLVIDCRGYAARADLPELRPVRGEMFLVRTREVTLRRPVRLLHPRIPLYVVPRAENVFMIGATMIESGDEGGPSLRSAIELLSAAYALHPAFGEAEILEMRAGIRPAFPDNEPRVVEANGRIHVNGFYRHGYLLAPHFAALAAEMAFQNCGIAAQ